MDGTFFSLGFSKKAATSGASLGVDGDGGGRPRPRLSLDSLRVLREDRTGRLSNRLQLEVYTSRYNESKRGNKREKPPYMQKWVDKSTDRNVHRN